MYGNHGVRAYRETDISSLGEEKLLVLLYEKMLEHFQAAEAAADAKQRAEMVRRLNLAQRIVVELRNALDHAIGGDIARNLNSLYDFAFQEILAMLVDQDPRHAVDCRRVLEPLLAAWRADPAGDGGPPAAAAAGPDWRGSCCWRRRARPGAGYPRPRRRPRGGREPVGLRVRLTQRGTMSEFETDVAALARVHAELLIAVAETDVERIEPLVARRGDLLASLAVSFAAASRREQEAWQPAIAMLALQERELTARFLSVRDQLACELARASSQAATRPPGQSLGRCRPARVIRSHFLGGGSPFRRAFFLRASRSTATDFAASSVELLISS